MLLRGHGAIETTSGLLEQSWNCSTVAGSKPPPGKMAPAKSVADVLGLTRRAVGVQSAVESCSMLGGVMFDVEVHGYMADLARYGTA